MASARSSVTRDLVNSINQCGQTAYSIPVDLHLAWRSRPTEVVLTIPTALVVSSDNTCWQTARLCIGAASPWSKLSKRMVAQGQAAFANAS